MRRQRFLKVCLDKLDFRVNFQSDEYPMFPCRSFSVKKMSRLNGYTPPNKVLRYPRNYSNIILKSQRRGICTAIRPANRRRIRPGNFPVRQKNIYIFWESMMIFRMEETQWNSSMYSVQETPRPSTATTPASRCGTGTNISWWTPEGAMES